MRDTQVDVSGASTGYGIRVLSTSSLQRSVALTNSRITVQGSVSGYGLYFDALGQATITSSQISATSSSSAYGLLGFAGNAIINHSEVIGATSTVQGFSSVQIGSTRLDGGAVSSSSAICAGVYDESYVFTAGPTCP